VQRAIDVCVLVGTRSQGLPRGSTVFSKGQWY